jgi:hypothetical protein
VGKKLSLVMVSLIGLTMAVPAAANSGSGDSVQARHVKAQQHVKRFVLHESVSHPFDAHRNAGTDVLRRAGKLIGYDSFTNHFNPRIVVFRFALALKHGQIVGRVVQQADRPGTREGPILFGSGRFAGIEGTATINFDRHNRQHLILRYQL